MAHFSRRWAAAALLLAACDGAAGPGQPTTFSVDITTPAVVNETVLPHTPVLLSAQGSAGGAAVADPSRYEWRVHGRAAGEGNPLNVVLEPGPNRVAVALKDEAGQVVAVDSTLITVPRRIFRILVAAAGFPACSPVRNAMAPACAGFPGASSGRISQGVSLPSRCSLCYLTGGVKGRRPMTPHADTTPEAV